MKIHDFKRKKDKHQKISVLTCYDYPSAKTIAESEIDCVLVGDSVAMMVHGYDSTIMATMDMMIMHTKAVAKAIKKQFIIADMPFLCHKGSILETVHNVRQLMQAGAHGIKIEGCDPELLDTITHLVGSGIPIMGHIGLTPQSIHHLGGYVVQGKQEAKAEALVQEAKALEAAGTFALVLECVPAALAKTITNAISIPTIGIGAGCDTDGQVLVWHDTLGLQDEIKPRFVKEFLPGKALILEAINAYAKEVQASSFPSDTHSF